MSKGRARAFCLFSAFLFFLRGNPNTKRKEKKNYRSAPNKECRGVEKKPALRPTLFSAEKKVVRSVAGFFLHHHKTQYSRKATLRPDCLRLAGLARDDFWQNTSLTPSRKIKNTNSFSIALCASHWLQQEAHGVATENKIHWSLHSSDLFSIPLWAPYWLQQGAHGVGTENKTKNFKCVGMSFITTVIAL